MKEHVSSRPHESEVGFPDFASFELGLELAGLETASCEEQRAGSVLVWSIVGVWSSMGSFVGREGQMRQPRAGKRRICACVPCQGGELATVLPQVRTAVALLPSRSELNRPKNCEAGRGKPNLKSTC